MTWLTVVEYLCYRLPHIYSFGRYHNHILLSTVIRFLANVARRAPPLEQEMLILTKHLSSPHFCSGPVAQYLAFFFSFWPLYCLSSDVQLLINLLLSSDFSNAKAYGIPWPLSCGTSCYWQMFCFLIRVFLHTYLSFFIQMFS